ncbi:ABC transporter ATP-binding protein [Candidatus Poribacteria bacterium]|nr:ABC transporter ATP-binding protein [Candidatus Poribacteria bacterium]MBT5714959.1 ABC transporter ATP-binding protein [Candidatus Poribacteria bacterium]MBT7100694.1 ABC transporter ATP-binding protein [Candidatus Poribacteria bacterium]MBT7807091.1 ABC transporter ATP-binding protein [Candidatus Poribacteria bacterium]
MTAVDVRALSHRYGERLALNRVSLAVPTGSIYGLLGPNGGGKSTLFRVLSTLLRPTDGTALVLGRDVRTDASKIRPLIGVVLQGSYLDGKLTVRENLMHRGRLHGLHGARLKKGIVDRLAQSGLADRISDRVETLSGGLRRRCELAGCMLHDPSVLLLDEPTAGLDPVARAEFWTALEAAKAERDLTILLTSHLMDEAERCDRLALLNAGEVVAEATPDELKSSMGYEVITVQSSIGEDMAGRVRERVDLDAEWTGEHVRIRVDDGKAWLGKLIDAFPGEFTSITLSKPSIEDVFLAEATGMANGEEDAS